MCVSIWFAAAQLHRDEGQVRRRDVPERLRSAEIKERSSRRKDWNLTQRKWIGIGILDQNPDQGRPDKRVRVKALV